MRQKQQNPRGRKRSAPRDSHNQLEQETRRERRDHMTLSAGFIRQLVPVFCGNQLFLLKTHKSQFSVSERLDATTQAPSEALGAQTRAA